MLGRHAELAQLTDLLWNPDVRLVSLLGPGGIGKTRLAVEVARELQDGTGFVDGVHFVDLAPVADPDLVAGTVARTIGLVDMGTGHDVERLCEAIRDRDMLLVLDNFEQVIPAVGFVGQLLAAAPRLSMLVTSRVPLHLRGEHEIVVRSLSADDALALFVARARAVNPSFELDDATTPLVESVCAELDRLPLAIELAAARSKVLSPAELHARLGRRLDLLSRGPADQPVRLQSMRATISWSYDALAPEVQSLCRQLAVFASGWTLDAAEAVCATAETPVVDGLTVLLEHHLVRRDDTGAETRFGMFETVREFGRQESVDEDDRAIRRRHAEHFLSLAGIAEVEIAGADQATWLDRVETEHDNVRAALHWALDSAPDIAIDLAGTMWRFWVIRGYVTEGLDWLERCIATAGGDATRARARANLGAGSMLEAIGDDEAAEQRYLAGLRDWEDLGDRAGMAIAYRHLGNADIGRGRYAEATLWYERTRRLGEQLDDQGVIAGAVSNLGSVAYFEGNLDRAAECWREAANYFRASNDANRLASILNNVAELEALRGDPAAAVEAHEQVMVLRRQLRDPIGLAQTLVNLGSAVQATGDLTRARSLLEEALHRLRNLGVERDTGSCLYNLAVVARAEGRTAEAAQFAGESLSIKHATGEKFDVAQCLELIAGLAADHGLVARATRLLGASGALRRSIGARPSIDAGTTWAHIGGAVSEHELANDVAEGEGWTLARSVAEATELALVWSSTSSGERQPRRDAIDAAPFALTPTARRLGLTAREVEVLGYLVQRYTDREIAEALTISLRTVTTHVGRILTKLGVVGRRQAATEAARLGLVAS